MKKIFLFLNLLCLSVFAQSSVWKVSKGDNHIYIGGTIHILSKDDYPLPKEFTKAYNDSEILVFEANLDEMSTPEAQRALQYASAYRNGQSLVNYLSLDTLNLLTTYLQKEGFPVDVMLRLKPGIVTTAISLNALKKLGITEEGVDTYFAKLAKQDRKKQLYLESIEDQIGFITNIGVGNEENYIGYSMLELKNISQDINQMRDAWRKGNINLLNKKDMDILKNQFPNIYQNVLVNRNNDWIPKLQQLFRTKKVEYVLVGALHLSGKDGILYKLKSLGYKVEQL